MGSIVRIAADRFPLVRDIGWNQTDTLYTHPDRILDYHVYLYVTEGAMQVIEEGVTYVVQKNEFLFLTKGLHHWGLPVTPAGTSWYWIHFNMAETETAAYKDHPPLPELEYYYPDYYHYWIHLPKHGVAPVGTEEQLSSMIKHLRLPTGHKMTRTSLSVHRLFLDLQATKSDQEVVQGVSRRLVEQIMVYLCDRLEEPYDAAGLQAHMNMNYSYLSTTFKKATGQSIVEAHTKLKMNKAVELMRNTSMNIGQISQLLGYQNPFYFSRVFKKIFGEPPSSFMRQFY